MEKAIVDLLTITKRLREKYDRRFTLDGKLVGDIGEVLAKEYYHIELLPEKTKKYDATEIGTNKQIQIKSTMKGYFSYPFEYDPDYLIAIKIVETGKIEPIYNGPGKIIRAYIIENNLQPFRNSYYSFRLSVLEKLNDKVKQADRIKVRQ